MKVPVRAIGRPYRNNQVGQVFTVSRREARVLVSTKRVELADDTDIGLDKAANAQPVKPAAVAKAPAKAAAKKAPAKKAATKTATKTVRGTRNASMAGKTDSKSA